MIEVHLGLAKGAGDPELFDEFEFTSVVDTRPGLSEDREYKGHAVDGDLAFIGTSWRDLPDLVALVSRVVPKIHLAPGSRLEFESRSEEHTSELQSLRHLVCR